MKEQNNEDPWVCNCCGEVFDDEIDLNAHLFNSDCEKELKERHKENDHKNK